MHSYAPSNLRILRDVGLVRSEALKRIQRFQLTELGQRLRQEQSIRPTLQAELFHFLYFTLSEDQERAAQTVSGWSWVYRETCRLLWDSRPTVPNFMDQAATLNQHLVTEYPEYTSGVHPKSPNAAELWVRELDPPFLHMDTKPRTSGGRPWCSPELLTLAIDRLYRINSLPHGTPILLDERALANLSLICLVEPQQIEEVFQLATATFPFLSYHSGEWGRSAILAKPLSALDIL